MRSLHPTPGDPPSTHNATNCKCIFYIFVNFFLGGEGNIFMLLVVVSVANLPLHFTFVVVKRICVQMGDTSMWCSFAPCSSFCGGSFCPNFWQLFLDLCDFLTCALMTKHIVKREPGKRDAGSVPAVALTWSWGVTRVVVLTERRVSCEFHDFFMRRMCVHTDPRYMPKYFFGLTPDSIAV